MCVQQLRYGFIECVEYVMYGINSLLEQTTQQICAMCYVLCAMCYEMKAIQCSVIWIFVTQKQTYMTNRKRYDEEINNNN